MCIGIEIPFSGTLIVYTLGNFDRKALRKLSHEINTVVLESGLVPYQYKSGLGVFLYGFVEMTEGIYHKLVHDLKVVRTKDCVLYEILIAEEAYIPRFRKDQIGIKNLLELTDRLLKDMKVDVEV